MPAIALLVKESLSWLIKVVTTPRNIEYGVCVIKRLPRKIAIKIYVLKASEIIPNFNPLVSYLFKYQMDYLALLNTAHCWNS